jgi:TonB family protein
MSGQMARVFSVFLACAFALASATASAQRIVQPREGLRPATMVQPVYSDAARAAGVQGDVTIRGMVHSDGSIAEIGVVETSRSAVLDEAAMSAVRQWRFLPVETAVPYQVQIEFRKDDLNTLATKICSDLNIDVAYFRQAFPESVISDMPLKDVLVGLMMVVGPRGMMIENIRRSSDAFDRTVEWCASRADELVLERFLRFAR